MSASIHIGSCAWSFEDWRGVFYPAHLPHVEWLKFYSARLPAVEVDSTFYHTPSVAVVEHWLERTPPEFVFACKVPREITHDLKLRDFKRPLAHFLDAISALRPKLGAVLVQLPPFFHPASDEAALRAFVRELPEDFRFVIEFRHPEWNLPRTVHLLEKHRICWGWSDTVAVEDQAQAPFGFLPLTTDVIYLRLMGDGNARFGGNGHRAHRYRGKLWSRESAMEAWVHKIKRHVESSAHVFVFANNHYEGFSPETCRRLAELLGLPPLPAVTEPTSAASAQLNLL